MGKFILSVLVLLLCFSSSYAERVTLVADWHSNDPYYVSFATGISKGFFREEDIDLKIEVGKGSYVSTLAIDYGRAEFAIIGTTSLLLARSRGIPVVAVMQITEKIPHAIFCRKDLNVLEISDLRGKSVIYNPLSSRSLSLQGFLRMNNLWGSMTLVSGGGTAYSEIQCFLDKKVDCIVATYYMTAPILDGKIDYSVFLFYDLGLKIPHQTLAVHQDMIIKRPDLIKRFLRATVKSFKYSRENPDESLDIYSKMYPESSKDIIRSFFSKSYSYMYPDLTRGFIRKDLFENANDFLKKTSQIKELVDIESSYTNRFLEDIYK